MYTIQTQTSERSAAIPQRLESEFGVVERMIRSLAGTLYPATTGITSCSNTATPLIEDFAIANGRLNMEEEISLVIVVISTMFVYLLLFKMISMFLMPYMTLQKLTIFLSIVSSC